MRRRLLSICFLMALVGLFSTKPAQADAVDNFTYRYDGQTYAWQLPESPTPDFTMDGVLFEFDNFSYTLNGVPQTPAILDFFHGGSAGGGFELSTSTDDIIINRFGRQLYQGGEYTPTFIAGKYKLVDGSGWGGWGSDGTLTISVSEAGSLLLMGAGFLGLAAVARKVLAG